MVAGVGRTGKISSGNEKATLHKPGRNRTDELPGRAAWKKTASDLRGPRGVGFCACRGPVRASKVETKQSCFLKCSLFLLLCCFVGLKNAIFFLFSLTPLLKRH